MKILEINAGQTSKILKNVVGASVNKTNSFETSTF